MRVISVQTPQTRVVRCAAVISVIALAFPATACTVEKKRDPSLNDTPTAAAPAAAVSAAPGTSAPAQAPKAPKAVESPATPSVLKASTKTSSRRVGGGGERDSVTQPKFEIDSDGKIRRIKR